MSDHSSAPLFPRDLSLTRRMSLSMYWYDRLTMTHNQFQHGESPLGHSHLCSQLTSRPSNQHSPAYTGWLHISVLLMVSSPFLSPGRLRFCAHDSQRGPEVIHPLCARISCASFPGKRSNHESISQGTDWYPRANGATPPEILKYQRRRWPQRLRALVGQTDSLRSRYGRFTSVPMDHLCFIWCLFLFPWRGRSDREHSKVHAIHRQGHPPSDPRL
jgi:hypothetical protein